MNASKSPVARWPHGIVYETNSSFDSLVAKSLFVIFELALRPFLCPRATAKVKFFVADSAKWNAGYAQLSPIYSLGP
ncbi:hypothetical protein D3C87_1741800 [compost metagenome]